MELNQNLHNFFEGGFCDAYWPTTKDPIQAGPQTQQVLDLLGAKDGHILDWRGGWGSHALYFAQKGFRVSLLDFSQRYIDMAKAMFSNAGIHFTPILADCRQTPPDIQADFAVCMGNSVGFLDHREEVKAFVINEKEEFLLLKRPSESTWEVPSGALEAGESPLQGLARELREELGDAFRFRVLGPVHATSFRFDSKVTHMLSLGFVVQHLAGHVSGFRWGVFGSGKTFRRPATWTCSHRLVTFIGSESGEETARAEARL